jgi:2-oxo-4-hydroxy-4-carboxy--5-ureidoimidazoline (OHCU) decarboxylase
MLGRIEDRLTHSRGEELPVAAEEQRKITRLRLNKLVT